MSNGYIAQPKDYWIAPNAVYITLNALGEANRIQGSVASGASIMCWIEGVDGLGYTNGHEYQTWPLTLSPTYFNSDTEKYVYCAIPRRPDAGTQAAIVFPSELLNIEGKNEAGEQIGLADYYYIFLQGIIGAPAPDKDIDGSPLRRRWSRRIGPNDWGFLDTAAARDAQLNKSEWYEYSVVSEIVTFLRNIKQKAGTTFLNLILNNKELTDVATDNTAPPTSTSHIVTPAYVSSNYLSKLSDDIAQGVIGFVSGLWVKAKGLFGIDGEGNGRFNNIDFSGILSGLRAVINNIDFSQFIKSEGARSGFLDGTGILMDATSGKIEADSVEVRGFFKAMEVIINRLQLMESDYSFTEGDTTERVDFTDGGQRMVLTMHKEHDNDHTPFYPGDILYAKINDLLDHGTYYTCWVRVVSTNQADNTIKVAPYPALKPTGDSFVPGAKNFTFIGTEINGTDFSEELLHDYELFHNGYEKILNLTRHGNVADGLLDGDDPSSYSDDVKKAQLARQQSWVLSTTDKRLSFFWNVDAPIISDDNYALCLGILPDLANLPTSRDKSMPSLYVNTIFADNIRQANYPARVIKEDRGQWSTEPTAEYDGETVSDPYHCRSYSAATWLRYRNSAIWRQKTDEELRRIMEQEKVDLEISRTWHHGCLWECTADRTTAEPGFSPDWKLISGYDWRVEFSFDRGTVVMVNDVRLRAVARLLLGTDDVTDDVLQRSADGRLSVAWRWQRIGNDDGSQSAADEMWKPTTEDEAPNVLLIDHQRKDPERRKDCGPQWEKLLHVVFRCTATMDCGVSATGDLGLG